MTGLSLKKGFEVFERNNPGFVRQKKKFNDKAHRARRPEKLVLGLVEFIHSRDHLGASNGVEVLVNVRATDCE